MKSLHLTNLFSWSEFNEERNIDFNSVLICLDQGNIVVDPLPLSEHDLNHLKELGGIGWIVLTTGNKSEMAMGYATLYGDMAGGFAVLKDVPKTTVYELCRWRNGQGQAFGTMDGVIPVAILDKPPSAELREGQLDADSLPPYEVLDPVVEAYVENDLGYQEMVAQGFDPQVVRQVIAAVDRNEYKRRQAPPGVKITHRAFGKDRRLPIVNRYRQHEGG